MPIQGSFIVPPGQSPPFAIVTETDHQAWIIVATAFGLCCSLLFGGIRIFVRLTIARGAGLDDALLAVGTILAVIQSSLILKASSDGFGKTLKLVPEELQDNAQKLYYAGMLFFVIIVGLSKLSVAFFLLRIAVARTHRQIIYALAGVISVWTFASLFAVGFQCDYAHPWTIAGERCSGSLLRWRVISAFDILTEICLVGGSLMLSWGLHSSVWTKAAVVTSFAYRLLMIIPIAFRLANFHPTARSVDPLLVDSLFSVWTQAEINYSLVSATIPGLRPFAKSMNTQFGGIGEGETSHGYGRSNEDDSKSGRFRGTFQMSNMEGSAHRRTNNRDNDEIISSSNPNFTGKPQAYNYSVWAPGTTTALDLHDGRSGIKESASIIRQTGKEPGDTTSVSSNNSQQMIIKKEVTYEVEGVLESDQKFWAGAGVQLP